MIIIKKIIFACTGNTCRSVMAEALFRSYWNNSPIRAELIIDSAGIYAFDGDRATSEVYNLLNEEGIDVSRHRSKRLTAEMINGSDMVIVMTRNHRDHLLQLAPDAESKVILLKEYTTMGRTDPDIADPYGGELEIYRNSLQEIKQYVLNLIDKIEEQLS